MPALLRIAVAVLLFEFPLLTCAASFFESFVPGTTYYFDSFDPGKKPWNPGPSLNIEEVFKNFQYFEIRVDQGSRTISVIRFLRGTKVEEDNYLLQPDESLLKQ